jgi:hypothetical protein
MNRQPQLCQRAAWGLLQCMFIIIGLTQCRREGGAPKPVEPPMRVHVSYPPDLGPWLDDAVIRFQKLHPEIHINLDASLSSRRFPTAPYSESDDHTVAIEILEDSLKLGQFESKYRNRFGKQVFGLGKDRAVKSLLISPVVLMALTDRAALLEKSGPLGWKKLRALLASKRGWPEVGGPKLWGEVRLARSDPDRSGAVQTLLLLTSDAGDRAKTLDQLFMSPGYQTPFGYYECGVLSDALKCDIWSTNEAHALTTVDARHGPNRGLRILYPQTTIALDYPIVVVNPAELHENQRHAAQSWIAYLLSAESQTRAQIFGFRPSNTATPIATSDPQNPWSRLAPFGAKVDLPQVEPTPDEATVRTVDSALADVKRMRTE